MKRIIHTTSLSTLAACTLLLGAPSASQAAAVIKPSKSTQVRTAVAAPIAPLTVSQLPEIEAPQTAAAEEAPQDSGKQPLRIYIPNPKALRDAASAAAASRLDSENGTLPGTQLQAGNAEDGNGDDIPSITLPTVTMNVAQENTSRHGALYTRTDGGASKMEQALALATSPITVTLAAMTSMFDNTRIVITSVAAQMEQEAVQIAQRQAAPAETQIASVEPAPATAPKPVKRKAKPIAKTTPAKIAPALNEVAQAPAAPQQIAALPAPALPPQTREQAIQNALPVPAADIADGMPAAPAQALTENSVQSAGPIMYYNREKADFTKAQAAADMARLVPAAGVETLGPQGPIDTSPAMGAPESPAPLIAPTTTQTINAPGVASETPSPVAAPPSKSESVIAVTETKALPADVKKTLSKTPSGLTTTPPIARGKKPVDIDRTKEGEALAAGEDKAAKAVSVEDRMNVKVKQRAPSLDLNYELELAYNELMSGNTEAAIQRYMQVLTNDPNNKNGLFGLATVYHRLGQTDKARALYTKLLKLDPGNRDGLNNYLALASEEAPQEALVELQSLESRNPTFGPIPAQMAIIYQRMGQNEQAIEKMMRAVSLAPNNITYLYNLAILLDKAGKYKDAAGLYKQIIEASYKGETIPADVSSIQQRLTFLNTKP